MDDLDLLVQVASLAGDTAAGLHLDLLRARGIPSRLLSTSAQEPVLAGKMPAWSEAEDRFLKEHLGFLPEEEIAAALGRSVCAVHLRWKRDLGLPAPSKHPDYITAHQIALALGCDGHKVVSWIDRGLLPGEILPGGRVIRRVKRSVLARWVVNPANWIWFDASKVVDPHLRRLVELKKARWGDEWWTTNQVAEYHGVDVQDVKRYIQLGRIKGVQAPNRGGRDNASWANWFILRSEALKPGLWFFKGASGAAQETFWSDEGDCFLLLARAVGCSINVIARMVGGWHTGRVSYRLKVLHESGNIPYLVEKYDLALAYNPSTGALLADWRRHRARFPVIAREMERFRSYLAGEYVYPKRRRRWELVPGLDTVARVLYTWANFHAGTDEQRQITEKFMTYTHAGPERLAESFDLIRTWGAEPI